MLIEQIIGLQLGLRSYMYSYNWLFSLQNKNFQGKSLSGLLFTAKTFTAEKRQGTLLSLLGPNHLQNFTSKHKILNVFCT